MKVNLLIFVVSQKDHRNCTIQLRLLIVVIFRKLKQKVMMKIEKVMMMMMMQYTNCVVKAHKVQTVKLTLYKYKSL